MTGRKVRIGCGAGFWGDSPEGAGQIVDHGDVDYLVMDYLAEITMSILARMKAKRPDLGYASDFISAVMTPLAGRIAHKGIRVVTNAGGVNPHACRDALARILADAGIDLKIAVVTGDDLMGRADVFREAGICELFSKVPMPTAFASVNAYLGALPIAAAFDRGADIVITGRVVDSAIVLGPLIHEFGWKETDYDLLSAGSLAGHVIECGAQATGGIVTDWRDVGGWEDMGFPIAECAADGSFVVTKPEGTGGRVWSGGIAEQITYEVGDPTAYVLPDVVADWSAVRLEEVAANRVRVCGARGYPPTASYKVSGTYLAGYRAGGTMMLVGRDARARAEATGTAILSRAGRLIQAAGFADFSETNVEIIGSEMSYGAAARASQAREVVLKIAVRHPSREALAIFAREIFPAAASMAQGLTGFAGGRPEPQPVVRLFSFLVPKDGIEVAVEIGTDVLRVPIPPGTEPPLRNAEPAADHVSLGTEGELTSVPLVALAFGRSGDKGDIANIGVIARDPAYLPFIARSATPAAVATYFAHFVKGDVERFDWPGLGGFNFLLHRALGGGGVSSLRHDPQGKALAQVMLDFPVEVPGAWLREGGRLAAWSDEVRQ